LISGDIAKIFLQFYYIISKLYESMHKRKQNLYFSEQLLLTIKAIYAILNSKIYKKGKHYVF